ncbi:LacI family transcriptional regulator [Amylibacter kogurei]|uniref:LacI family transcriptional regulator n=1 Tax=Paramylibacter kogurei TaxID=1889778 RepID=A0A2G5KCF6_9RHOB|nr:LacI family DNA-binding transcriptional regulator [Amylibacter kogurei]PIB26859.1 LacI family transcriptional regulator [Amylibacter kogurei]
MTQKLTLKDIAAAAGVSEMTASRALRNAADVSQKTRERVEAAAAELGYVRNKIAGALASNKVDLVGVVIPSVKSYVFSEVLDGISSALAPTKLRPVFGLSNYDLKSEQEVISEMLSWRPSGLIVAGLEHNETARKILQNTDTPVVEIMDVDGDAIDMCVGISHYKAGYQMAQTIVERGHKNIGFIGTKMESDFRAEKRLNGFVTCLAENNITLMDQELYRSGSSVQKGKEFTKALLERSPALDCIYCSTDVTAVGAFMHCWENNISIPDQLSLAGFNDLTLAHGLPQRLATTNSMRFEIGQKAAEMILECNAPDGYDGPKVVELSPQVQLGDSL